jgi:hypothetical protein
MHSNIFVVPLGNCTIETISIGINSIHTELAILQEGLNTGKGTGHVGKGEIGKKGIEGRNM